MPYDITQSFRTEKDKLDNDPLTLYRIEIDDNSYLYLAEDIEDVSYFQPGTSTPQTYTKSTLQHSRIEMSNRGEYPTMEIVYPNIDRYVASLLHHGDGLRGREVIILTVFRSQLADSNAYIMDKFYIYSCQLHQEVAIFTLSTVNVTGFKIPFRRFQRDVCQWIYKPVAYYSGTAEATSNKFTLVDSDVLGVSTKVVGRVVYFTSGTNSGRSSVIARKVGGSIVLTTPMVTAIDTTTQYKVSTECGYFGALTTCKKTFTDCKSHGNYKRFGGFPGIPHKGLFRI